MSGLSLAKTFQKVNYQPHRGQRMIHGSGVRHRVASAGRRFGKTMVGGHELVPYALLAHVERERLEDNGLRREYWIVGPQYSDSEKEFRVFYDACKRMGFPLDRPGTYNDPHGGDLQVSLWGGRFFVVAKSARYPETLVGEGLSGALLVEAAKLKLSVWNKYIRPALADFQGWSLFTSTPEGKNWFYEMWQRGQDEESEDYESWRLPSWMNDHIFTQPTSEEGVKLLLKRVQNGEPITEDLARECGVDHEIAAMLSDMSEERFRQEVGADFTDFVGRVFKEWDEEIHVRRLKYRRDLPVYLAVDYGWTNPFVALAVQVDRLGRINVLREYRQSERTIYEIAEDLANDPIMSKVNTLYPDPAEPGDTEVLRDVLRCRVVKRTGGRVKDRLELIRQSLKTRPSGAKSDKQRPNMMVDRSCTGLIFEMGEYSYPDNPRGGASKEVPKDEDDHGPEALGRFFKGYYGRPKNAGRDGTRSTGTKTTQARVSRSRR